MRGSDLFSQEKSSIDGLHSLYGFGIDDEIDKRIEVVDGSCIPHLWTFDAQCLGLTVDAFTTGALAIDGLIERAGAI